MEGGFFVFFGGFGGGYCCWGGLCGGLFDAGFGLCGGGGSSKCGFVDFTDFDAREFDEGAHEFGLSGAAGAEGEGAVAGVVVVEHLPLVGTEEDAAVGAARSADEEELGVADHVAPVGEQGADLLLQRDFVVAAQRGAGGVGSALGGVVSGLSASLLATGGVAVEGLVRHDDGLTLLTGAGGMFADFGGEGDDHAGEVATADHAHEDRGAGHC